MIDTFLKASEEIRYALYLDAYSFKKAPVPIGAPKDRKLYKTDIIINNRVLIRYERGNLAAGWMPIMCPHCHTRMDIPYSELEI